MQSSPPIPRRILRDVRADTFPSRHLLLPMGVEREGEPALPCARLQEFFEYVDEELATFETERD